MSVEAILEQIEAEAAAEATRRLAEARERAAPPGAGAPRGGGRAPGLAGRARAREGWRGTRRSRPAWNAPGRAWPSRSPGSWDWRIEMYEYGNARIAAPRGRRRDGPSLRRLGEAGSAAELLVLLERAEDWRPILREVAPLAADPQSAFEVSVERHRSARLGALPRWYAPPARGLAEARGGAGGAPRRGA